MHSKLQWSQCNDNILSGIELVALSGFTGSTDVVVDRPFVFVIRDAARAVPIFVGRVLDPRQ